MCVGRPFEWVSVSSGTQVQKNDLQIVDLEPQIRLLLGIPSIFAFLSGRGVQVLTLHTTNEPQGNRLVDFHQILLRRDL